MTTDHTHQTENAQVRWGRGWRVGPQRWDWLRSIRCALTGHRWAVNARRTQRCCGRCWMVQNPVSPPGTLRRVEELPPQAEKAQRPEPCEHETEPVDGCAFCAYLAKRYDGWEPWEGATWD